MIGNNTNNLGNGGAAMLIQQLSPTTNNQPQSMQQRTSISQAQLFQEEQELAAILRNKELELQKQLRIQESAQVIL
jgi:cytoplasmic iron level regulating protein YaaA (DUF328/UPF0246 family)